MLFVCGVSGPAAISLLSLGLQPVSGIWNSSAIIPPVEVLPRACPSDNRTEVEVPAQVVAVQQHCSSSWDKLLVAELAHTENINHFKPKISEQCNFYLAPPLRSLVVAFALLLLLPLHLPLPCSCLGLCLALAFAFALLLPWPLPCPCVTWSSSHLQLCDLVWDSVSIWLLMLLTHTQLLKVAVHGVLLIGS